MTKNTEFQLLAMNEEAERSEKIAVIVKNTDLKAGKMKFYAFRENSIYSPTEEFKPISGNAVHKLKGAVVENYNDLIPAAKIQFEKLRNELFTPAQNSGSNNSAEIEILETQLSSLRNVINSKTARINEQTAKIAELTAAAQNNTSSQTDKMAELISAQTALLEKMKPKTITVQINENTRELTGSVVHERFEAVLKLLYLKQDVFMAGPAGTGKSHIAEKAAEALGLEFYFETSLTQKFELTGYKDGDGNYHDTQFYRAFVNGGVFMLDEIDASTPEVLVVINTALAQRYFPFPNGAVKAHPDFRVVAAGNTIGKGADIEYTGRYQLDASTMDRFKLVKIDYSPAIEQHIVNGDTELLEFTHSIRNAMKKDLGMSLIVSYRFMNGVKQLEDVFELPEILDMSLLKGMAEDDVNMLVRNMSISPANKYYKALKTLA
jgi:hypothetical protein